TCSGATDGTGSVVDNDSDDDDICNEFDPCPYWPYNCSDDGNTLIVAEGQSIGDAVDAVPNGGTILIMQGTHLTPSTINTQGKEITIKGELGEDGNLLTTLDGNLSGHAIFTINSGDIITTSTIIKDLVITKGGTYPVPDNNIGGGIIIFGSGATIENCHFIQNYSRYGGGIWAREGSNAVIEDCIFEQNLSVYRGGAIFFQESEGTINGSIMENNNHSNRGGGIALNGSSEVVMTDCIIQLNTVSSTYPSASGGIHLDSG
ncbi:uncharacterized protein METZ01_LOCUS442859, partial [marine metagenome]